jgi:hypothetical protein
MTTEDSPPAAASARPAPTTAAGDPIDPVVVAATTGTAGRARALTVISPLPRVWAPLLKLVLRLKRMQGPDPALLRMSVIHAAHWVVIDRFPGEPRKRRYAYLLFVSNFNGSWREYIDAFATAVPGRMSVIWGTSYGFPGPRPPVPFVNYIERNQRTPSHFYSAYPQASATEVASALRVDDDFRATVSPEAGADDPAALKDAWDAFLVQRQRDL